LSSLNLVLILTHDSTAPGPTLQRGLQDWELGIGDGIRSGVRGSEIGGGFGERMACRGLSRRRLTARQDVVQEGGINRPMPEHVNTIAAERSRGEYSAQAGRVGLPVIALHHLAQ
jgi:hypothetical protein